MEDNNEINSELEINENAEIAEARVETKVQSHHNNRPFNTIHVKDAIIEEIGSDRHSTSITITYREAGKRQTVRLLVTQSTRIWDEKGRPISVRLLEIGMMIDTVFSNAMTKSIPPQAEAFQIKVVLRQSRRNIIEGRIGQVDVRNQYILVLRSNSPASVIRFNIAPETRIFDWFGRPISLENLFPGLRVQVEHANFMTASIPPQTTAFVIRVIR